VLDFDGLRRYTVEPVSNLKVRTTEPTVPYLALSGGAADGAYGIGVLNGWSATGTRPTAGHGEGVRHPRRVYRHLGEAPTCPPEPRGLRL